MASFRKSNDGHRLGSGRAAHTTARQREMAAEIGTLGVDCGILFDPGASTKR